MVLTQLKVYSQMHTYCIGKGRQPPKDPQPATLEQVRTVLHGVDRKRNRIGLVKECIYKCLL